MIETEGKKHNLSIVENITNDIFCIVSGILDNIDTHAVEIANLTIKVMHSVSGLKMNESPDTKIQLRIGIHTGWNVILCHIIKG